MIKWKEEYSIGDKKLDEQHKNLFVYCNDLEGILQDGEVTKRQLKLTLRFLELYVKCHFGQEESCMHKYSCPIAATNQQAHEKFIQTYKDFEKKISQENNSYEVLKSLHTFLEKWLVDHICKIDTQLKPCIHE